MLVIYDEATGEILLTLDESNDVNDVLPQEGRGKLATLVEHGAGIRHLRVDLETKTLVPKSAIVFKPDRYELVAGESVIIEFTYEGEQFGSTFPLQINTETVLQVPYEEPQIQLTLDLPGEYTLSIPDLRIHSVPHRIRVKEDVR